MENFNPQITRRNFLKGMAGIVLASPLSSGCLLRPVNDSRAPIAPNREEKGLNPRFIQEAIEQTPYKDQVGKSFLSGWFKVNNNILPRFLSREDWKKQAKNQQFLIAENNQKYLLLPDDLKLWEMPPILARVDQDTFQAANPERAKEKAEALKQLGVTFQKAGIYLAHCADKVSQGRNSLNTMTENFYRYGLLLQSHQDIPKISIEDIRRIPDLPQEEKAILDEWFLGPEIYGNKINKLQKQYPGQAIPEEAREALRLKTLNNYFKALSRKGYEGRGEKPWERKAGPFQKFHESAKANIAGEIGKPRQELENMSLWRGKEQLLRELRLDKIPDQIFLSWINKFDNLHKTIYAALDMPKLKKELDLARQQGDINKIAGKEREIAANIQGIISLYPYDIDKKFPQAVLASQAMQCTMYSLLGGALLKELGINYLSAGIAEHALTLLAASDGRIYWQDFMLPKSHEITEADIDRPNPNQNIPVLPKLIALSRDQNRSPIKIKLKPEWFKKNQLPYPSQQQRYLKALSPETGEAAFISNSFGSVLKDLGKYEEAIRAYQKAIELDPEDAEAYNNLGVALQGLGKYEEAIMVYQKAIELDPERFEYYSNLGNVLKESRRYEEAIRAYQKAIELNPEDAKAYYNLGAALKESGRQKEAITAYQNFLKYWNGNEGYRTEIEKIIQELKKNIKK